MIASLYILHSSLLSGRTFKSVCFAVAAFGSSPWELLGANRTIAKPVPMPAGDPERQSGGRVAVLHDRQPTPETRLSTLHDRLRRNVKRRRAARYTRHQPLPDS